MSRLTLAIAIITGTLRVGWPWVRRHLRDLAVILLIGLPLMWGLSVAALMTTLPLPALTLVLLAAIATPTDPVLAQAIVTSETAEEKVPEDVRHLISADSAGNDGLAFLFVTMRCGWSRRASPEAGRSRLSDRVGIAGRAGDRRGVRLGHGKADGVGRGGLGRNIEPHQRHHRVGVRDGHRPQASRHGRHIRRVRRRAGAERGDRRGASGAPINFNHALAEIFQLPLLVLLGMTLPFNEWYELGRPLLFAVILVLLVRRIPMLLALKPWLRAVPDWPSALFVGWLGQIGIGSLFDVALALRETRARRTSTRSRPR